MKKWMILLLFLMGMSCKTSEYSSKGYQLHRNEKNVSTFDRERDHQKKWTMIWVSGAIVIILMVTSSVNKH